MMLGFSETEVREMIRYYQSVDALKADEDALIAEMKPWYDGYCRCSTTAHAYIVELKYLKPDATEEEAWKR